MYDHPPSRQGSPCPSIVGLPATVAPVKPHRTHSPIPHLSVATLLPHHHHHSSANCSRQYSPNSKQSDVSRLLDPSYASTSASSVNVGPHARMLTTVATSMTRITALPRLADAKKACHKPYPTQLHQQQREAAKYSTYPLVARPEWERDWATEVELDEDDEDEQDLIGDDESQDNRASNDLLYHQSPVDSLDDDPVIHEEYHSYADESESSPKQKSQGLLRRMKRMSSANDVLNQPAEKPEYAEEHEMNSPQEEAPCEPELKEEVDDVPSCTNGLRQQWRAFTLRLRFGVFHAKRRLSVSPITKRRKTI
ncbi:hypothetical protein BC629DRAFT_1443864 [Irpex lacteus]|nr:hypothetical protein BC629DRAFT_1443864 [Irpex lacteus]